VGRQDTRRLPQAGAPIPGDYYVSAVRRAYPAISFDFDSTEKNIKSVVDRVNHLLKRQNLPKLDKRMPVQVIASDIRAQRAEVPDALYTVGTRIFGEINQRFADAAAQAP
jgi:hypothetical protein